jgi:anaerobic ribonucleoside-triphosphate reductase activating protein
LNLHLSRAHFPVTALGPGRRLGIWFQGCSIRCPGCISADTWALGRGLVELSGVLELIDPWLSQSEGVTISGGEPFDQPEALHTLLISLRERSPVDILVFTGHPIEALPSFATNQALIDVLITDPYRSDLPQTLALRGSDNQRLHCLTALGQKRFSAFERERTASDDRVDIAFDAAGTAWMAGIPKRGDLNRLLSVLHEQGHEAHGTFDVRASRFERRKP